MPTTDPFDYSTVRTVTTGLRFPEGPIALDDGSVLVSEIEGGALNRVLPDGSQHPIDCGGGVNGAALGPDGAAYVCNDGGLGFKTEEDIRFPYTSAEGNEGGYVQRVDIAADGAVETVFTHVDGEHLGGLNDIVFDSSGSCYVVDTGLGAVHYADPATRTIRCVERGLSLPNGMGLSPDGSRLYVTETYTGNVFTWRVIGPGTLSDKQLLFSDGGEHGWDGLAVDGAGNVCASNLKASGVSVIDSAGDEIARFVTPEHDPYVTNICFGGHDGDTAYICSSGRGILYSVRWPWGGLRLNFAC
jgi:gluconolactonase